MKFSIITISYNRASLIVETIESVLEQTYQNFEMIIVDDGSTDNTEEIIANYIEQNNQKIRYIKSNRIGKPSVLRNIGIKEATGDIISILDSDDIWLPKKLQEVYNIFIKHENISFMIHNLRHFVDHEKPGNEFYTFSKDFHKDILKELLFGDILAFPVFSMRKSIIDDIGYFNENIMEGQHDYYLRVAIKHKIYYLNQSLTLMRRHEGNLSKNFNIIHSLDAITSLNTLYKSDGLENKLYKSASNFMNYKIAKFYFKNNEKQKAIKYIDTIFKHTIIINKWNIKSRLLKLKHF